MPPHTCVGWAEPQFTQGHRREADLNEYSGVTKPEKLAGQKIGEAFGDLPKPDFLISFQAVTFENEDAASNQKRRRETTG